MTVETTDTTDSMDNMGIWDAKNDNFIQENRALFTFGSRLIFSVLENDSGDVFSHGIVLAPMGMSVAEARELLTETFVKARDESGPEWNYDDIFVALTNAGFRCIGTVEWWAE